jgi:hypothetical protein
MGDISKVVATHSSPPKNIQKNAICAGTGTGGHKEMSSILVNSVVSADEHSCAHGAQINPGYLTP